MNLQCYVFQSHLCYVNCEWYCLQIEVTFHIILPYSVVNDARYECASCKIILQNVSEKELQKYAIGKLRCARSIT